MQERLGTWLERWRQRLHRIKIVRVLRRAAKRYRETEASQGAAGLAYYMLFSLFPLMLLLVTVASYILNLRSESAFRRAVGFVSEAIPVSQDLISGNLNTVLERRGTVGVFGLISTLWSASGAFTILSQHVNAAWSSTDSRSFVRKRLAAFAMVGAVALLLLLSLAGTAALQVLPRLQLPDGIFQRLQTATWPVILRLVPLTFTMLMFLALYRWAPTKQVSWRAVLWGSGVTAMTWEIAKSLFTWFLNSGLANYRLVYGSLGSVVALLFWIYISASIALFGAHLTAALDGDGGIE
ncbi:MAG: YihY/virulence factor BrkB family protein [Anaerolineae bacterium]|nr:YihY/virulence factor BrkB family protein [Anaerolineae bacterium]